MRSHLRREQEELRDNVRLILKERGIYHRVLGGSLGLTPAQMSALMLGHKPWSREQVEAAASFLELSPDELLGSSTFTPRPELYPAGSPRNPGRLKRQPIPAGRRRALCCECGQGRLVSKTINSTARSIFETSGELAAGRMLADYKCSNCGEVTRHAILRDDSPEYRDLAEKVQAAPSADQVSRRERDALVARMEGFGVTIAWRSLGNQKWRRKHGKAPCIGVQYDESKSQWRVEINPEYPPSIQLPLLRDVWEVIALDDTEWWDDISPTSGAWLSPSKDHFTSAVDGLVDEITRQAPAVLLSITQAVRDETRDPVFEAEETDQ